MTTEERVFEFRAVNREDRRKENEKCRIMAYIEALEREKKCFFLNFP